MLPFIFRRDEAGTLEYAQPTSALAAGEAWFPLNEPDDLGRIIREDGPTDKAFHAACYLAFLALSLVVATVSEVLGDYGLLHELAHGVERGAGPYDTGTLGGSPCSLTVQGVARLADNLRGRVVAKLEDLP